MKLQSCVNCESVFVTRFLHHALPSFDWLQVFPIAATSASFAQIINCLCKTTRKVRSFESRIILHEHQIPRQLSCHTSSHISFFFIFPLFFSLGELGPSTLASLLLCSKLTACRQTWSCAIVTRCQLFCSFIRLTHSVALELHPFVLRSSPSLLSIPEFAKQSLVLRLKMPSGTQVVWLAASKRPMRGGHILWRRGWVTTFPSLDLHWLLSERFASCLQSTSNCFRLRQGGYLSSV